MQKYAITRKAGEAEEQPLVLVARNATDAVSKAVAVLSKRGRAVDPAHLVAALYRPRLLERYP